MKPKQKPNNPCFSSGPCAKRADFSLQSLQDTPFGRSHRSKLGKGKLVEAIERTKELLKLPEDYLLGIVPGSDTGAFEMAMWNLLGTRAIDIIQFEAFGKGWGSDITDQLKLEDIRFFEADYGQLPDLSKIDFNHDVVFTWNGTTSGVKVPNGDWIADNREGLTLCDATSAVFAMEIPWSKIDVATFSWQKVLGGEAAHGMLILSPRAVERIKEYTPPWPMPKIFRLKNKGEFIEKIFKGSTINTPSLLCNEDYLKSLDWVEANGGLQGLILKSEANLKVIEDFVEENSWIDFLVADKEIRSNTSVTLKVDLSAEKVAEMIKLLEENDVAYDIASYRDAPVGLRIWCGATVETDDIKQLVQWLKWVYNEVN